MKCLAVIVGAAACAAPSAFVLPAAPLHQAAARSLAVPSANRLCARQQLQTCSAGFAASRLHSTPESDTEVASEPAAIVADTTEADAKAAKKAELAQTLKVGDIRLDETSIKRCDHV